MEYEMEKEIQRRGMKSRCISGVIRVPQIVDRDDYHDFESLQADYRKVVPGIKVKEIGFNYRIRSYIGMVYLGTLKDSANRRMLRDEERYLKKIELDYDRMCDLREGE